MREPHMQIYFAIMFQVNHSQKPLSYVYTHILTDIQTYYITHIETNLLTQEYLGHSLQLASSNVPLQLGPQTGSFGRIWHTEGH